MARRTGALGTALPAIPDDTLAIPSAREGRIGVLLEEVGVRLLALVLIERGQPSDVGAFEHGALLVQRVVDGLGQDAVVAQSLHGGFGEFLGVGNEATVAFCFG